MRIIVVSDTHRSFRELLTIVNKHKKEASLFIHLGDGEDDVERIREIFPDLPLKCVKGNCDYSYETPLEEVISVGGVRIFCTHGHRYHVKTTLELLKSAAKENTCTIALYGHSHQSDTRYEDGLYLMNPGSPSCPRDSEPSYGIIDITPQGIFPFLVNLSHANE